MSSPSTETSDLGTNEASTESSQPATAVTLAYTARSEVTESLARRVYLGDGERQAAIEQERRRRQRRYENTMALAQARDSLYTLFASNQTDMMLLGGYNSIVVFLQAGMDVDKPYDCTTGQHVCSWLVFTAVMIIHVVRHYLESAATKSRLRKLKVRRRADRAGDTPGSASIRAPLRSYQTAFRGGNNSLKRPRPMWFRVGRALLFGGFLLCMHAQPVSCAIGKSSLKDLRIVQGSALVLMSMMASAALSATNDRNDDEDDYSSDEVDSLDNDRESSGLERHSEV